MTARELIANQVAETEFMLGKAFEGLDEESSSRKVGNLMSAKETAEHLCECYLAAVANAQGEKFEWGKYSAPDKSWDGLMSEFRTRRAEALEAVNSADEEKGVSAADAFIVGHDHYHVGQLCAVRLGIDPEWDYYSIYR